MRIFVSIFVLLFSMSLFASIKAGRIVSRKGTRVVTAERSLKAVPMEGTLLRSTPYILSEGPESTKDIYYQEYLFNDKNLPADVKAFLERKRSPIKFPNAEVRTLVNQGPKENRINLTILGDGYTLAEKNKFFDDAMRTTQNLFTGSTFASYLPLFNVYAVFTPSAESGIGDGDTKDTVFQLYRSPPGSKRAIMPGDSEAAEEALQLAPATDFPIILANDNFYGGLGGRFAISTSSVRSGMIVLRHELGHNFGDVGEEYDGGYVYRGANSSDSRITWSHWVDSGKLDYFESKILAGDYVWQNLKGGPYSQTFNFPSGVIFLADISTVGWSSPDDVITAVDGHPIQLGGTYHNDRNFYTVGPVSGLAAGKHTITFTENVHDGDNVLAFSNLYALPANYDFTANKIAAFATFDDSNHKVGYRPTHDSCLMRNMMVPYFCSVDKENMWLRFLNRLSLIDGVAVTPVRGAGGEKVVSLQAAKLNGLTVAWYQVGGGEETELPQYRNLVTWKAPAELAGSFKVRVTFKTPEVRKYTKNFVAEKAFSL